jgi:hypothetical protein
MLQSEFVLNDNSAFCYYPGGHQADIAYFPEELPGKDSWAITVDPNTAEKKAERAEDAEQSGLRRQAAVRQLLKDESEKNTRTATVEAAGMMSMGTEAIIQKKARTEELANVKALVRDMPSPDKRKAIEMAAKMAKPVCECKIIFVNFPTHYSVNRRTGKTLAQSNETNIDLREHMSIADLYSLITEKCEVRFQLLEAPAYEDHEILIHLKTSSSDLIRIYNEDAGDLGDVVTSQLDRTPVILIVADDGSPAAAAAIAKGTRRITHPSEIPIPEQKAKPEAAQWQDPETGESGQTMEELQQTIIDLRRQQANAMRSQNAMKKQMAMKIRQEKELARAQRTSPENSSSPSIPSQAGAQLASPGDASHHPSFISAAQIEANQEAARLKATEVQREAEGAAAALELYQQPASPATSDQTELSLTEANKETSHGPLVHTPDPHVNGKELQGSPSKKNKTESQTSTRSPARSLSAQFNQVQIPESPGAASSTAQQQEGAMEVDAQVDGTAV